PFLFDIIRYFRKSNVSESKRLFTLKRHYFKRLPVDFSSVMPTPKLEYLCYAPSRGFVHIFVLFPLITFSVLSRGALREYPIFNGRRTCSHMNNALGTGCVSWLAGVPGCAARGWRTDNGPLSVERASKAREAETVGQNPLAQTGLGQAWNCACRRPTDVVERRKKYGSVAASSVNDSRVT
ncbi:hypothetical protein, partial [Desulfobulbus sp.]|uniref:hypothetical protein n=1 Tax=Desulfobulbus sp. TaxID=895 RepID=UPI00286F8EFF